MALFADRITLVVGGARGMGRATALAFAREGATVIVCDRLESGAETARMIQNKGGNASFVSADIGEEASVDSLFAEICARFGRLDAAFNAAAIALPPSEFADTPVSVWDDAFRINTRGTFLCMRHQLRIMKAQRCGAIVTVASGAGLLGPEWRRLTPPANMPSWACARPRRSTWRPTACGSTACAQAPPGPR